VRVLAIDPGPEQSAWLLYDADADRPVNWAKEDNEHALYKIERSHADALAVEMIASYGMPVGAETFETCVWAGRFIERWKADVARLRHLGSPFHLVFRREVKLHLCGNPRANDGNVRQALIDRYGPGKEKAIGRKASPGPLYGLSGDGWAALGVAVTFADTRLEKAA
jgi:hypothetical protein